MVVFIELLIQILQTAQFLTLQKFSLFEKSLGSFWYFFAKGHASDTATSELFRSTKGRLCCMVRISAAGKYGMGVISLSRPTCILDATQFTS